MSEPKPALPDSVLAIGEQLAGGGPVRPAAELFQDRGVFAAEFARLFLRPWTAVEHASRLDGDGRYFRFEVAARSVIVVRETAGRVHALRNACLHAGYRVCDAEDGTLTRLHCVYHDWEYALDGELTYPALTRRLDQSRYRLANYPLQISNGIVFVDLSREGGDSLEPAAAIPDWLGDAAVAGRARYSAACNWKCLLHLLQARPELAFGAPPERPPLRFGTLGLLALREAEAALLRIVPKSPEQTDLQVIRLALPGAAPEFDAAAQDERMAAALPAAAEAPLDRDFFAWYWSLIA